MSEERTPPIQASSDFADEAETISEISPGDIEQPKTSENEGEKSPLSPLFSLNPQAATDKHIQDIVNTYFAWAVGKNNLSSTHNILFFYSSTSISRFDANRIYDSVVKANPNQPTLLIVHSFGGDVSAAYFIAKLCREHTKMAFEVVVPRLAKSAATLICCGADRIHMGSLSELGPIDPQFGQIPALALKHSVEHLAQLAAQYPEASTMLSEYLAKSLRVEALGYYERVAESATQYAVRLLNSRINGGSDNEEIAKKLVYSYKDHGFAIDASEATEIFGETVVIRNSAEYEFANEIYGNLDLIDWVVGKRFNRIFSFVGDVIRGCSVYARQE